MTLDETNVDGIGDEAGVVHGQQLRRGGGEMDEPDARQVDVVRDRPARDNAKSETWSPCRSAGAPRAKSKERRTMLRLRLRLRLWLQARARALRRRRR